MLSKHSKSNPKPSAKATLPTDGTYLYRVIDDLSKDYETLRTNRLDSLNVLRSEDDECLRTNRFGKRSYASVVSSSSSDVDYTSESLSQSESFSDTERLPNVTAIYTSMSFYETYPRPM